MGLIIEKCENDKPVTWHFHNANEIVYIKQGSIDAVISGKSYFIKAPSILFINNLEVHSIKINETPYVRYFMLIPNDILHQMPNGSYLGSVFIKCLGGGVNNIDVSDWQMDVDRIFSTIYAEYKNSSTLSNQFILNSLSCLLISILRRHPHMFLSMFDSKDNMVYKAKQFIDNNFSKSITIKDLADHLFVSTSHISHTFKQVLGLSPKQYLIVCRLAEARHYLLNSEDSISKVAFESGYKDVNNFIRHFKKEVGISPLQYKKNRELH